MRGYFAVGVEGISKSGNLGNLYRTAHAFGASFVFTIDSHVERAELLNADTSHADDHMPYYEWPNVAGMQLPKDCQLVGVELVENSIALPRFKHPLRAAYVLGPELGSLSSDLQERCKYIVQIPSRFCLNVGIAGALVMYDRILALGQQFPRGL
ncbi:MAG: TrmH family RNA methyltransferase [Alphaproteobacteria bacterium]|nr:TrmH family RNA methyltransferase [Alphaproteobacteria bacterium]NDC56250.1 TrmH family RNA methyltransferase [Alphaproteobacteria bacterium]NDG05472.1 TrmH family RNA methyltransferase [Alphaproteobacteria bacterium]